MEYFSFSRHDIVPSKHSLCGPPISQPSWVDRSQLIAVSQRRDE